jgi:hypothetical protein
VEKIESLGGNEDREIAEYASIVQLGNYDNNLRRRKEGKSVS